MVSRTLKLCLSHGHMAVKVSLHGQKYMAMNLTPFHGHMAVCLTRPFLIIIIIIIKKFFFIGTNGNSCVILFIYFRLYQKRIFKKTNLSKIYIYFLVAPL
jgi:hypothetical protein